MHACCGCSESLQGQSTDYEKALMEFSARRNLMNSPALFRGGLVACCLFVLHLNSWAQSSNPPLIRSNAVWKYLADGSNQEIAWRQRTFNDSSWPSGPAQLGFGDGDEATTIGTASEWLV